VPEFPLVLTDAEGTQQGETTSVVLGKLPAAGSWFDLPHGAVALVKSVRWIGSEPVIFAVHVSDSERSTLNPKRRRRVLPSK